MLRDQPNDEPVQFSLRTLFIAVLIAAIVAAIAARIAPLMSRTDAMWYGTLLSVFNLALLFAGSVLFGCKSNELRALGLMCWVYLIPLMAMTIGLISFAVPGVK